MRANVLRSVSVLLVLAVVATSWAVTNSNKSKPLAEGKQGQTEPAQDPGFVVHEWGTFTTFSGANGVHLDFRPLDVEHNDLPGFVIDRAEWAGLPPMAKSRILARVRMETPVTYFYTDKPRTVNVGVEFPEGLLTEFYPPVRSQFPKFNHKTAYAEGEQMGNARIDWGEINLIPTRLFRPDIDDQELAGQLQQLTLDRLLPTSSSHPHYQHARETDAALVHMNLPQEGNRFPGHHLEKFLFYRGVGKFNLPIQVVYDEQETAQLVNDSNYPLSQVVVIDVRGGEKRVAVIDQVKPNEQVALPTMQLASDEQIAERVRFQLTSQGLYEKEAAAMVATWQDSWFTEQGTRVLYSVPEALTNKVLPLHISPQPKEMVRVLVGRLEIMTPSMEQMVTKQVRDHAERRRAFYEKISKDRNEQGKAFVMPKPLPFPEAIAKLDRFAEPALARLVATSNDDAIRNEATYLIHEMRRK